MGNRVSQSYHPTKDRGVVEVAQNAAKYPIYLTPVIYRRRFSWSLNRMNGVFAFEFSEVFVSAL